MNDGSPVAHGIQAAFEADATRAARGDHPRRVASELGSGCKRSGESGLLCGSWPGFGSAARLGQGWF